MVYLYYLIYVFIVGIIFKEFNCSLDKYVCFKSDMIILSIFVSVIDLYK